MIIKSATFICSNTKISALPVANMPEYAFIGRSNVGKSSLINMLVNQHGLAKTSQKPGKTQLINHFLVNEKWYIVDLPGYGYAKVSKTAVKAGKNLSVTTSPERESLQCVFVLIDSRLPPQKIDIEFCCWMGEIQIPFVLAFTKSDKQSVNKTTQNIALFKKELSGWFEEIPPIFATSAEKLVGKDEILNFIDQTNLDFAMPILTPDED